MQHDFTIYYKLFILSWFLVSLVTCVGAEKFSNPIITSKYMNIVFWWQMFEMFYSKFGFGLDPKPWMNHIENLPYLMGKETAFFEIKVSIINRLWDTPW